MPQVGGTSGPADMTSPPVGGGAGQILTKNSNTSQDWSWQPGPLSDPYVANTYWPGYWYTNVIAFTSSTTGASSAVANTVHYCPLFLPNPVTISALGYALNVAGGGQTSMGVYSTIAGLPSSLLCSVTGMTQVQGANTKSFVAPYPTIPAGWTYLATAYTSPPSMQSAVAACMPTLPGGFAETPNQASGGLGVILYSTTSGGTLPVSPTTFTMGSPGISFPLWFRVAT